MNGDQKDQRGDIPVVYGLATIYSSVLISFGVFLAVTLVLLLEAGFFICVFVGAALLLLNSILRYRTATNLESCCQPTFAAVVSWYLLSQFCFYATSHQPTMSQINWRAAFVGRSANFDHSNFISGILAFNYNSIGLFHDSPPDDDFDATPQYGKKLHSIFYDDFSETIIPSQMDAKPKSLSSYIFEEPPPDSFQGDVPPLIEKTSTSPLKEQSQPNIFEEPPNKCLEQAPSVMETTYQSQSPRLESEGKIASIIDRMQQKTDLEADQESTTKVASQPKKLNSNLKINVTALLPGAKRPQYKPVEKDGSPDRQVLNEPSRNENDQIVDSNAQTIQTESDPNKLQSLNNTRAKIQVKRRPSTRKARQENYRRSVIENDTTHQLQEDVQTVEAPTPSNNLTNVLKETLTSSVNEKNRSHQLSASMLFNIQPPPIPSVPNEPQFKPSVVFFEDEPPDNSLKPPPPRKAPEKPPTTTSLFFENDSDDDDFIAATVRKSSSTTRSKEKSEPVKPISERKSDVHKNLSSSLFDDDESDDSDLFAKSLPKAEKPKIDEKPATIKQLDNASVAKTGAKSEVAITSKTLFGSDDDDDDLFGRGVSATKSNMANAEKSSNAQQILNSGRLFDDDDDDDLFGGAKQKNIPQPSTKRSDSKTKTTTTKSSQLSKPEHFNDPLADLFKN